MVPATIDDFEGFKTPVEEVTADVMGIAREQELEIVPEDVTELPRPDNKILMDELLLKDEQIKWIFEIESTSGEDTVNTVKMTGKDLKFM